MTDHRPCIVVGYDGSPTARVAVELGARRAGDHGLLVAVHACDVPPDWYGWPKYQELLKVPLRHGREVLDRLPLDVPASRGGRVRDRAHRGPAGDGARDRRARPRRR